MITYSYGSQETLLWITSQSWKHNWVGNRIDTFSGIKGTVLKIILFIKPWQKAVKVGGVDRLTDTSKYTGSHKERFDESGKGKGIEGRVDRDDKAAEGYVGGYKGKDTYDKTHLLINLPNTGGLLSM